jgi:hypothetical protein
MLRIPVFTRMMTWTLVIVTLMGWSQPEGWAMLAPPAPTAPEAVSNWNRVTDLQTIQRVLETKIVQQRLQDWGLMADEIEARLSQLSDEQVHQMATQLDALIPGGELGLIILLLVIAIIVVLVLYLTGNKVVVEKSNGVIEKK